MALLGAKMAFLGEKVAVLRQNNKILGAKMTTEGTRGWGRSLILPVFGSPMPILDHFQSISLENGHF